MPNTKVAIRARVQELDRQVAQRKATLVHQQDERRQLQQDCAQHGGHVVEPKLVPTQGGQSFDVIESCNFCGLRTGIGQDQLARNLTRA